MTDDGIALESEPVGFKSFEDLSVWNKAIDLAVRVFEMTATGGLNGYAGLRDQIERAAVSVSNNIAEGFDRGTHEELLTFLYYSRGSLAEVRSMLHLLNRIPGADRLGPYVDDLLVMNDSVSRQLGAWIASLKDSPNRGPRHQNTATRTREENLRRSQVFLEELERIKNRRKEPPTTDT